MAPLFNCCEMRFYVRQFLFLKQSGLPIRTKEALGTSSIVLLVLFAHAIDAYIVHKH